MSNDIVAVEFSQLPNWVKVRIRDVGISNPENWIKQNIPALNNHSVIEILKNPDGDKILRDYFSKVIGKL